MIPANSWYLEIFSVSVFKICNTSRYTCNECHNIRCLNRGLLDVNDEAPYVDTHVHQYLDDIDMEDNDVFQVPIYHHLDSDHNDADYFGQIHNFTVLIK